MERTNNGSTATTSGVSDKVAEHENLPGKVYFIRHGESTSNERNIFAGVLDVDLTAFGRLYQLGLIMAQLVKAMNQIGYPGCQDAQSYKN